MYINIETCPESKRGDKFESYRSVSVSSVRSLAGFRASQRINVAPVCYGACQVFDRWRFFFEFYLSFFSPSKFVNFCWV